MGLTQSEVSAIVQQTLDSISDTLADGHRMALVPTATDIGMANGINEEPKFFASRKVTCILHQEGDLVAG